MRIRMYNAGFGDCFCLREKNENLLVDFGTSNHRIGGRRRRDVFDLIIADLSTLPNKNLLLSNLHPDHLSGLLYLLNHRETAYEFDKIYLPDVFSTSEKSRTLALLLLADLLKDSWLPSRQVSLYALAEALCKKPRKVEFLSRGKQFEKKYIALWPDTDYISEETERILKKLWPEYGGVLEKLIAWAEMLRKKICAMSEAGERAGTVEMSRTAAVAGDSLWDSAADREFLDLRETGEFRSLLEYAEKEHLQLRSLKHQLSVVFQNTVDDGWNLLFTGDAQPEILWRIADNYDGACPLHEHYWCVKVPHHGTASHYFDFSGYTPENMLISGGTYYTTGKRKAKAARISPQYAGLFHTWDVTMWCSENECCDGCRDGCSCRECEIISPRLYLDIR